jgi:1,4-dihydroxy-2-naphthoate octaprenyltransferase
MPPLTLAQPLTLRMCLQMTRPNFIVITEVACLLGIATSMACGHPLQVGKAIATLALAALLHAAANVLNDYHDARNGADAANHEGLFPFTGGARFIQNGQVTVAQTGQLAWALMIVLVPSGMLLAVQSGGGLIVLGLVGLLAAWAYSAPPLALMTRGLGEFTVGLTWLCVVVGADYVQRGQFFFMPWVVGLSFALLVANVLLINGFPDAKADASVGKCTAVVRLGPVGASMVYGAVASLAYAWVVVGTWLFLHPEPALWGLVSIPLSLIALVLLFKYAQQPAHLKSAIVLTIAAAVLHGLATLVGLLSLQLA